MQTCVKYTSIEQVFSSWLSHWRTGGQGHQGSVGWALQIIQHYHKPSIKSLMMSQSAQSHLAFRHHTHNNHHRRQHRGLLKTI